MNGRAVLVWALALVGMACGAAPSSGSEPPYQVEGCRQIDASEGRALAADGAGSIYVSGFFWGSTGGTGSYDAFLSKYDASGNSVWFRHIGTAVHDNAYGVALDRAEGIYTSGRTSGDLGTSAPGPPDAFLTRYDPSGNLQWVRQFGTWRGERCYAVATDLAGNAYTTGSTEGSLDGPNAGGNDVYLAKHDPSGNLVWCRQMGTSEFETGYSVAADGAVYIAGTTAGSLAGPHVGQQDAFLVKYNESGDLLWSRQIASFGHDNCNSVAVDNAGDIYVTGFTQGSLTQLNAGRDDVFLAKYNPLGDPLWCRQIGTEKSERAHSVAIDNVGGVYITGETHGDLGGPNAGDRDVFLAKYDTAGTLLWSTQIGTSEQDWGYAVAAAGEGCVYITGRTEGGLGGPATGSAVFLIKYTPEPATFALLAVGAAGMWVRRARRRPPIIRPERSDPHGTEGGVR